MVNRFIAPQTQPADELRPVANPYEGPSETAKTTVSGREMCANIQWARSGSHIFDCGDDIARSTLTTQAVLTDGSSKRP
jgi:hypothetical protein